MMVAACESVFLQPMPEFAMKGHMDIGLCVSGRLKGVHRATKISSSSAAPIRAARCFSPCPALATFNDAHPMRHIMLANTSNNFHSIAQSASRALAGCLGVVSWEDQYVV